MSISPVENALAMRLYKAYKTNSLDPLTQSDYELIINIAHEADNTVLETIWLLLTYFEEKALN